MISIIITIYNAQQYLDRCLRSVLGQSYADLEIICVDDGSTDDSGRIVDKYAKNDKRVKVLHKQNSGFFTCVSARKNGLSIASSEYIGWVDADDWVEPDYFEKLYEKQQESGADIITAGLYSDSHGTSRKMHGKTPPGLYRRAEVLPTMLYAGEFFSHGLPPHMVSKLIRKEILAKALLQVDDAISYGEDAAIFYGCTLEAKTINVTDVCGYHYEQHPHSMAHHRYHDERQKYDLLMGHLENIFMGHGILPVMRRQLEAYKRYYAALRLITAWDTPSTLLLPYGGIAPGSRVAIYGAGVMGQHLYSALKQGKSADIRAWLDRDYTLLQEDGLGVSAPDSIREIADYDYVLIANTSAQAADDIRSSLLGMDVPSDKIRWLSDAFLDTGHRLKEMP